MLAPPNSVFGIFFVLSLGQFAMMLCLTPFYGRDPDLDDIGTPI